MRALRQTRRSQCECGCDANDRLCYANDQHAMICYGRWSYDGAMWMPCACECHALLLLCYWYAMLMIYDANAMLWYEDAVVWYEIHMLLRCYATAHDMIRQCYANAARCECDATQIRMLCECCAMRMCDIPCDATLRYATIRGDMLCCATYASTACGRHLLWRQGKNPF